MNELRTLSIDIQHSVFENSTAALLYLTRDIYDDSFVIAIPVITFSWVVWAGREQNDLNYLLNTDIEGLRQRERKEKLVEVIKTAMDELR